ncbi:hypothetical protein HGP17_26595 [Rhizobium sp. P38BS-XIX]|uniref:hypothetical protein n=1 Tax=Rhizobium sp. P38BS-XIX TaxID=2726740 RepID=UPI0014565262|nr:hypothetical protein [Rhizobium sp. P38BS-XIX]NLS00413.1 hypothetical protein [Rhizobium sp. P38BS-XIX]
MPARKESPAVQSIRKEQKEQRKTKAVNELDKALEDTFPASDPISTTHTAVSSKRVASDQKSESVRRSHVDTFEDDQPVKDKAPRAARNRSSQSADARANRGEVRALYRAARQVTRSYPERSLIEDDAAPSDSRDIASEIQQRIREKPVASLLVAAAIGFVFALRR